MKKYGLLLSMAILAVFMILQSCTKAADGAIGPAGPAGPQGAAGPAGTANVIYSPWNTVTLTGSGISYSAFLNAPQITQNVLDRDVVLTYVNFSTGEYYQLPYLDGTRFFRHRLYVGRIELSANYPTSANQRVRYVIIPGGTPTGRKAAIDYSNYEAVKAYYNLPD